MKPIPARRFLVLFGTVCLIMLSCRTADLVARDEPKPQNTPVRTAPRPTFTNVPPSVEATNTLVIPLAPVPAPTQPAFAPARPPTARPAPSRTPVPGTAAPPPTPVPPPTADLYEGYYYRVTRNVCATSTNTRAEGIVLNNTMPQNGVLVRVSYEKYGPPIIDDFLTGNDPSDYKHRDPALAGKYRLGIFEGQQNAGNWWVFLVDPKGQPISVAAHFNTQDAPGCNTATIDFAH